MTTEQRLAVLEHEWVAFLEAVVEDDDDHSTEERVRAAARALLNLRAGRETVREAEQATQAAADDHADELHHLLGLDFPPIRLNERRVRIRVTPRRVAAAPRLAPRIEREPVEEREFRVLLLHIPTVDQDPARGHHLDPADLGLRVQYQPRMGGRTWDVNKREIRAAAQIIRAILARVEAGELTAPRRVVARLGRGDDGVGGAGTADT